MVRKVGFGDDKGDVPTSTPKKSIADQAMDRFRKRAKIKAAREAEQKKNNQGKAKRLFFLTLWLILWVGMSGAAIYTMASDGLNTNILPLVIWTGASVMVVSKVLSKIISVARGGPRPHDRTDNF